MKRKTREELLAEAPHLAGLVAKLDKRGGAALAGRGRPNGAKPAKKYAPVKVVKGGGGYKSYKATDWDKAAASRRDASYMAKPGLVVSKGRAA